MSTNSSSLSASDDGAQDGVADLELIFIPGPRGSGPLRFIARKSWDGDRCPQIEVLEVRAFEAPPKPVRAEAETALAFKRAVGVHDLKMERHCAALRAEGWRGELANLPFPLWRNEWVRRRHATSANPANSAAVAAWMNSLITGELESDLAMDTCIHAELRIFDLEKSVVDIAKQETCVRRGGAFQPLLL